MSSSHKRFADDLQQLAKLGRFLDAHRTRRRRNSPARTTLREIAPGVVVRSSAPTVADALDGLEALQEASKAFDQADDFVSTLGRQLRREK